MIRHDSLMTAAIAGRLRARRMELGLTQQELAKAVGVTYQQIHKYEIGHNSLRGAIMIAALAALDMTPAELLDDILADYRRAIAPTPPPAPSPHVVVWQELGRMLHRLAPPHVAALHKIARVLAETACDQPADAA